MSNHNWPSVPQQTCEAVNYLTVLISTEIIFLWSAGLFLLHLSLSPGGWTLKATIKVHKKHIKHQETVTAGQEKQQMQSVFHMALTWELSS